MVVRSRFIEKTIVLIKIYGAVAQLARAPALQAGGQEFDSPQLHHTNIKLVKSLEEETSSTRKNANCEETILIVCRRSNEEFWRSNTKFIISKRAHWKIYSRIYQIFQEIR